LGERQTSTYCIDKDHHDIPGFCVSKAVSIHGTLDSFNKSIAMRRREWFADIVLHFQQASGLYSTFHVSGFLHSDRVWIWHCPSFNSLQHVQKVRDTQSEALGMNTMYQKGSWAMEFMKIFEHRRKAMDQHRVLRSMDESI